MRCKNCGSENDDNLYICQNCGSPLYNEDDLDDTQQAQPIEEPIRRNSNRQAEKAKAEEKKKQQTIIIIAVLSVLLIAIIAGVIIAVANSSKDDEATSESTSITTEATTEEESAYYTTEPTTQTTTESTTTTTTTTTTQAPTFNVSLSSNEGGEVEGDGSYKLGEHITIIARPDDGYEFDGWYKGSTRVSKNTKYTFTVKEDTQLEAVFTYVGFPDESVEGEVVEP